MTSTNSPQVEEGDSRFLAKEVLHEVKICLAVKGNLGSHLERQSETLEVLFSLFLSFFSVVFLFSRTTLISPKQTSLLWA